MEGSVKGSEELPSYNDISSATTDTKVISIQPRSDLNRDLSQIIRWHKDGNLTDLEFKKAKNTLLRIENNENENKSNADNADNAKNVKLIGIIPNIDERIIIELKCDPLFGYS